MGDKNEKHLPYFKPIWNTDQYQPKHLLKIGKKQIMITIIWQSTKLF